MVMVDTKLYWKYVTYDRKGNSMSYVEMNKALYSLLQSAVIFHKKLSKDLEDYGFVINPYGPCVANDMIKKSPNDGDMSCGRPKNISQGPIPDHQVS